jgi:hypothetical protein
MSEGHQLDSIPRSDAAHARREWASCRIGATVLIS